MAIPLLLDGSGYVPSRVSFDDYYTFLTVVQEQRLETVEAKVRWPSKVELVAFQDRSEFAQILQWLRAHTRVEVVRDHPLSVAELRRLLQLHGFQLDECEENHLNIFQ